MEQAAQDNSKTLYQSDDDMHRERVFLVPAGIGIDYCGEVSIMPVKGWHDLAWSDRTCLLASKPETPKVKGIWRCGHCGNLETRERETICWECGNGEMLYMSREDLNGMFTQLPPVAGPPRPRPTLVK